MPISAECATVFGVKMEPFYQDPTTKIYNGDALAVLKTLPDESVQMSMTSPPYWGLRNYAGGTDIVWGGDENCEHEWIETTQGLQHENRNNLRGTQEEVAGKTGTAFIQKYDRLPPGTCVLCGCWRGQLGLEPTPELYVEHLMMIFQEVKRVLKKDGAFYLNIGDTYASSGIDCGSPPDPKWPTARDNQDKNLQPRRYKGLPAKCMTLIPERVMFALVDDGWILRNKIGWHKPNSMPSSVKDRFTTTWEYLYFFTKARKYYFDLDAIRIPHISTHPSGNKERKIPFTHKGNLGHSIPWQPFNLRVRDVKRGKGGVSAQGGELTASEKEIKEYEYPEKQLTKHDEAVGRTGNVAYTDPLHTRAYSPKGKNPGDVFQSKREPYLINNPHTMRLKKDQHIALNPERPDDLSHAKGKNPGDYWDITTQPSSICVCPKCEAVFPRYSKVCPICKVEGVVGHFAPYPVALCEMPIKASTRVGDVVLDPLAGGGNTGVAAKKLGRKCILIDCVKEYCIMARHKLSKVDYQPELIPSSPWREV